MANGSLNRSKGFTLIEILMVIAIIAIVSAAAIRWGSTSFATTGAGAVQNVATQCRCARAGRPAEYQPRNPAQLQLSAGGHVPVHEPRPEPGDGPGRRRLPDVRPSLHRGRAFGAVRLPGQHQRPRPRNG
jgi:prepilin-type N-terminal cleavage/methylation domain-containing protein